MNLPNWTCSCGKWDMTGIQCVHKFSIIIYVCRNPKDFVDYSYTMKAYQRAYAYLIYPLSFEDQWVCTSYKARGPPTIKGLNLVDLEK